MSLAAVHPRGAEPTTVDRHVREDAGDSGCYPVETLDVGWVTPLLKKEIGTLPNLASLDRELTWSLRFVPVDDVVEREAEPFDELAVSAEPGEILKLTNDRIGLVESSHW